MPQVNQDKRGIWLPNSTGSKWDSQRPNGDTPAPLAHGVVRTLIVPGAGTEIDYNDDNYTFAGERHTWPRFDFDTASTPTPALNTEAAWLAHLHGGKPILASTDFNPNSVACGATVEMTGGPTFHGKMLRRQVTEANSAAFSSIRLKNWCWYDQAGYRGFMHFSFYNFAQTFGVGKIARFYYTGAANSFTNAWLARTDQKYGARAEWVGGGSVQLDGDTINASGWARCDIFVDFDNGIISYYVNGVPQQDTSRGLTGIMTDWISPGSVLDYVLVGNTIDAGRDGAGTVDDPYVYNDEYTAWAQPSVSFSRRRIEIADSPVWAERTDSVIVPHKSWVDGVIRPIVNQGRFADLDNKHYFLLDGMSATYIGPVV